MRVRSPVFVGRRVELDQLSAWLDDAADGHPRIVVIGGEAGVGKSRLVEEFGHIAAARHARWLIGAAADYGEGGLPFGAIADALRGTGGAASVLAGTEPTASDTERNARLQAFERLLSLLSGLTHDSTLVLVLEDIHWADASTREFLAFLARNRAALRLLVVATYRSDDVGRDHPLHRYLVELQRGQVELMTLTRFDRAELRQQLSAIRGTTVEDRVVDALYARSQGNAFFSEELLASTVGDELPAALPPTLRDTMLARVDRLSAPAQRLLAAVAVAGTADEALLMGITGWTDDEVLDALHEAVERYVLQPLDGLGYSFRHALLREAIYQHLLAAERSRLHQRIATTLAAAADGAQPDAGALAQLAHHWELAGQPMQAFVAAWRAAVAADHVYAKPEASRLFERVADLWLRVPDAAALLRTELDRAGDSSTPADRATVLHRAAVSAASFALREGVRLGRRAVEHVDPSTDPDRVVLIVDRIATWAREVGEPTAAADADALLGSAVERASPKVMAQLLLSRSDSAIIFGDFERAREQAHEALVAADQIGQVPQRLQALVIAARAHGYCGQPDEAARLFDRVRAEALGAGLPFYAAEADRWQGDLYQAAGRFDESVRMLRQAAARMEAIGETSSAGHAQVIAAQALFRHGQWAEAAAELQRHLSEPEIHWARLLWAHLLVGLGRFEQAALELERGEEFATLGRNTGSLGPYYAALVEMALWRDQPQVALAAAVDALELVGDDLRWVGDLSLLGLRAAVEIGADARQSADAILANLQTRAQHGLAGKTIFEPEVRAALASADAEMSRVVGSPDPVLYAAAAAAWLAIPEPYPQAYALYRQAEALLTADRQAAREPLAQAVGIARDLGARPLLEMAEALARRARLDVGIVPAAAAADSYGLTAREREVLALIAVGRSDQEIARELFISAKTASVHVSNIKGKLGVEHRIQAAAIGLKLGLGES